MDKNKVNELRAFGLTDKPEIKSGMISIDVLSDDSKQMINRAKRTIKGFDESLFSKIYQALDCNR